MDAATETILKMIEPLPEETKNRIVDELRIMVSEISDEAIWQEQFSRTEQGLIDAAKRAKQEIADGLAKPMEYDKL